MKGEAPVKKSVCLVLVVCLLLSILPLGAAATTVLTASEDAIKILKAEEGFSAKPYWDYAQWTVGYGTACPEDKRAKYTKDGITQEEAEVLLAAHIAKFEAELLKFMNKTGVQLTQTQFDALLLFSYNCGSSWAYNAKGVLYQAIVGGATGNELIDAFARWCNAGGQVRTFLLRRRLCEANLYLNGVYSQKAPENYAYIFYDACGGVSKPNVQGYDTSLTALPNPVPTYTGYTFEGWYTQRVGGEKVEVLDASLKNGRVYAHWKDGEGNDPALKNDEGVRVTVTTKNVNVRVGAGTEFEANGMVTTGDQLMITETKKNGTRLWGKFYGGWISLEYTNYATVTKPETDKPVSSGNRTGTVKVSDCLRVRKGPSTGYEVVKRLENGAKVEILEEKIVGSMVWGKIAEGWISLDYVVLDPVETKPEETKPEVTEPEETKPEETKPEETKPEETVPPTTAPEVTEPETQPEETKPAEPKIWTGVVKVNDYLRVRSGPSTADKVVGYLSAKEKVTITEKTTVGSMTWGKTEKGWISLDYVVLDKTTQEADKETEKKLTGTVDVEDFLRIRSGPGTSYAIAGYLSAKDKVEITQQRTVGNTVWGKIEKGWISLDYVVLDKQENSDNAQKPETSTAVTKTVTASCLRIRSDAGTSYKIVGYLYTGAKVTITETKNVNGTQWGKLTNGWISMDYVK